MREESNELIVGTNEGVIKVATFRRRPEEDRWKKEELEEVRGLPWEPIPGREGIEIKSKVRIAEDVGPITTDPNISFRPAKTRWIYITKEDVLKMGPTPGCHGCISVTRGGPARNRNEACRTRMETAIAAYDADRYERALSRMVRDKIKKRMRIREKEKSKMRMVKGEDCRKKR